MKYALLLSCLLISGCFGTTTVKPEQVTVKQLEYIIRIPPSQLLELPPPVPTIEVDTAKQSDIARWILANEDRTRALENIIKEIAVFFKIEQAKAKQEADEQNKKELERAAEAAAAASAASAAVSKDVKK